MTKTILALSVAVLAAVSGTTGAGAFSSPAALKDGDSSRVTPVTWYGYRYKPYYGYGWKGYYYGYHPYRHYGWYKRRFW